MCNFKVKLLDLLFNDRNLQVKKHDPILIEVRSLFINVASIFFTIPF